MLCLGVAVLALGLAGCGGQLSLASLLTPTSSLTPTSIPSLTPVPTSSETPGPETPTLTPGATFTFEPSELSHPHAHAKRDDHARTQPHGVQDWDDYPHPHAHAPPYPHAHA